MAQKASELLEKESSTVLADTGYYNGTEIKNCVDAGKNVLIKKAKANNSFFLWRRQENVDAERKQRKNSRNRRGKHAR